MIPAVVGYRPTSTTRSLPWWAALMVMCAAGPDLGSLASYLVFVRQTALPINQLTQQGNFLLARAGRRRAHLHGHGRTAGDRRGHGGAGQRAGKTADGTADRVRGGSTGRWAWCDRRRPDVPLDAAARRRTVPRRQLWLHAGPDRFCRTSRSTPSRGRKSPLSAPRARARPRLPTSSTAFMTCRGRPITYDGMDVRHIEKDDLRRSLGVVLAGHPPVHRHGGGQHPLRQAGRDAGEKLSSRGQNCQRRLLHPPPAAGATTPW